MSVQYVKNCNGIQNKTVDKVSKMMYNESVAHVRRRQHIADNAHLKQNNQNILLILNQSKLVGVRSWYYKSVTD